MREERNKKVQLNNQIELEKKRYNILNMQKEIKERK